MFVKKDYSITLRDVNGKTCVLSILADSVVELMNQGYSELDAVDAVEQNEGFNAIHRGDIDADCWIESINK